METPTGIQILKSVGEVEERSNMKKLTSIVPVSEKLKNGDLSMKIEAAREIRSMVRDRNSGRKIRSKFGGFGVIRPLVDMLCLENDDAVEISLLTLLNLASKNKRNKEEIVSCGAIPPLVNLLKFQNTSNLGELAIAAIVTLSASPNNKAAIANSEAIPLLIQIISSDGTIQGRVDAYSKFAERATTLIEIISKSQEGINAITNAEDGILTLVETIEGGSLVSKEHALSVLLTLCISSRSKYRELILNEGAIPGLLRLTIDGTLQGRNKAKMLLDLLRDSPSEKKLSQSVLEKMVQEIAARVAGSERKRAETAKKLMQDMYVTMEYCSNCRPYLVFARLAKPCEPPTKFKRHEECKKYSKFAERATTLIEIISKSQEGINAITNAEDGILTLVETIEGGSLVSKEHALSVLLTLCISSRSKYRELILNEGAIPGLLRLTIDGTLQGRNKAKMLLDLLRDSPSEKKLSQSVLEKMVQEIAARVAGSERKRAETAKKLMQDMVKRRMARV
nr:hypothetical protein [Tanacetum cinerariifolium]